MKRASKLRLVSLLACCTILAGCASGSAVAQPAPVTSAPAAPADIAKKSPLFDAEVARATKFLGEMMQAGVVVPMPKDAGGGYTHEQHKLNFKALQQGGQLYRITGDQKYADYVRDMLLAYAELYPKLGDHPAKKNQGPGRIFWQVLNDAMWLVHAAQGYEAIRDGLPEAQRKLIDDQLFRKAVKFLSEDSKATFDKIHNHATWATAGVGMTGYVLGDRDMVDRALLGSDKSGRVGFLRQTDLLFSPDGYYSEGPYYQRFALLPFLVFANTVERNDPDRKIFEHRDGILLKALYATAQLTYGGFFFPFNDAIRDKSLNTAELYEGVAIAYEKTRDPALLSIAEYQGRTVLTPGGKMLSADLAAGKAKPFDFKSRLFPDGPDGERGALAILRDGKGPKHSAMVIKNTSQGLGHGHFDKLGWQFYDNGHEIIRDYGAARFLNIEAKNGGHYLAENESWAKQTVGHNTLVVDEKSHFNGDPDLAELHWPKQLHYSDKLGEQISSATIDSAYEGVEMTRTMAWLDVPGLKHPLIVDIMRVNSNGAHQYDLPLHYNGHILRHGFEVASNVTARPVLGKANGYQHIWVDATGMPKEGEGFLTWIQDNRFYTWHLANAAGTEMILGETGANDPKFNLRREPMIIARRKGATNTVFASVLETHGNYDGAAEQTVESNSQIRSVTAERLGMADVVVIETLSGSRLAFAVAYDADKAKTHGVTIAGEKITWTGPAARILLPGKPKETAK